MIILYLGIVLIILSLVLRKKMPIAVSFFFIFVIMAFQSNIEGDFDKYQQAFSWEETRTAEEEPLWLLLNIIFKPFGFSVFIFCLALFQVFILFKFVKKYVPKNYAYLSPILFFFTFGMMLIQMKALRQGLAIEVCTMPFIFNLENKRCKFFYCFIPLILACLIHNAAIIMIPGIFLYYLNQRFNILDYNKGQTKINCLPSVIVTALLVAVYFLKSNIFGSYLQQLSIILGSLRFGSYLEAENEMFNISPLIVFADCVFVFLLMLFYQCAKGSMRVLIIMTIISFFIDIMFFGVGSLPRMGYFYLVSAIVVLPNVAEFLLCKYGKLVSACYVVMCVGYAIKTSLPWLTGMDPSGFRFYQFVFLQ